MERMGQEEGVWGLRASDLDPIMCRDRLAGVAEQGLEAARLEKELKAADGTGREMQSAVEQRRPNAGMREQGKVRAVLGTTS